MLRSIAAGVVLSMAIATGVVFTAWGGGGFPAGHAAPAGQPNGLVTIVKDAVPDDPQDFGFGVDSCPETAPGPPCIGFLFTTLDDDDDPALPNSITFEPPGGIITVYELVPYPDWKLVRIVCDDGSPVDIDPGMGRAVLGVVGPGEHVTCVFINQSATVTPGLVTVVKDAIPDDPQDFSFDVTDCPQTGLGPCSSNFFFLDDDDDPTLSNSTTFDSGGRVIMVDEFVPYPDWKLVSIVCDDGSPVDIDPGLGRAFVGAVGPGEHVTCMFTNQSTAVTPTPSPTPLPTPTPTPTPAPTPTPSPTPTAVAEVVQLPETGGTPSGSRPSAVPWLAAIAGVIAATGAAYALARRRQA